MGIEFEFLPMEPGKPPENAFDGSNGFIKSLMPKWPPIGKHPPAIPFFFFDFDDSLRFRVWIPSFFIVNGRFTYQTKREKEHVSYGNCVFYESWARSRIYFHSGLLLCRLAFFAAFFLSGSVSFKLSSFWTLLHLLISLAYDFLFHTIEWQLPTTTKTTTAKILIVILSSLHYNAHSWHRFQCTTTNNNNKTQPKREFHTNHMFRVYYRRLVTSPLLSHSFCHFNVVFSASRVMCCSVCARTNYQHKQCLCMHSKNGLDAQKGHFSSKRDTNTYSYRAPRVR